MPLFWSLEIPEGTETEVAFKMLLPSPNSASLTFDELTRWSELKELVDDGSLDLAEVRSIFEDCSKDGAMDVSGFTQFDAMVDDLFEDKDEGEEGGGGEGGGENTAGVLKSSLLKKIESLTAFDPAAINCEDDDQEDVLDIANELCDTSPSNLISDSVDKLKGEGEQGAKLRSKAASGASCTMRFFVGARRYSLT